MLHLVQSQPAFLLHSRPYRDTSLIVDFITQDHGRISAVAKGVRNAKSKNRALLQPFVPLLVNLSGKSELKTLGRVEPQANPFVLKHKALFSAMYMNELIMRLIHKQEPDPDIFELYADSLKMLSASTELEPVLRCFELDLLEQLGYGIDFSNVNSLAVADADERWYHYHQEAGFEQVPHAEGQREKYYSESELILISSRDFSAPLTQKTAKRLLRTALASHLGEKPLASRSLFRKKTG